MPRRKRPVLRPQAPGWHSTYPQISWRLLRCPDAPWGFGVLQSAAITGIINLAPRTAPDRRCFPAMDNAIRPPAGRILTINADGSYGVCTHRRAKAFVRSGRAEFLAPDRIRFRPENNRVIAVSLACLLEYARRANYDQAAATGIATERAMRHIPIARADIALGRGQRTYGCGPPHWH